MIPQLQTNILLFLLFSLTVTIIHYIIPLKYRLLWLLFVNVCFYMVSSTYFIVLLVALTLFSWYCAKKIIQYEEIRQKKKWLLVGIISTASILCFFKYNKTFINHLLVSPFGFSKQTIIILFPLGLSYYSFKIISYLCDVYKGKHGKEINFVTYCTYVTLYTQITSGPISRYELFRKSLCEQDLKYKSENIEKGFYHVILGLFMKVVIANRLATFVSIIFTAPDKFSGIALWLAAFFYSIELYCDFGGYSYLAIGLTELLGLRCEPNFLRPYFAYNIKEFWNRWHISLSTWLRDYIYIPLGGNRCSKIRQKINIIITFLVSGIWHGAGLNFIIWGLYHGFLNIVTCKQTNIQKRNPIKTVSKILLNVLLVDIGWLFFGLPKFSETLNYLKGMVMKMHLSISSLQSSILPFTNDNTCIAYFLTVMFFIIILFVKELNDEIRIIKYHRILSFLWQAFLVVSVLLYGVFGLNGFIYANF